MARVSLPPPEVEGGAAAATLRIAAVDDRGAVRKGPVPPPLPPFAAPPAPQRVPPSGQAPFPPAPRPVEARVAPAPAVASAQDEAPTAPGVGRLPAESMLFHEEGLDAEPPAAAPGALEGAQATGETGPPEVPESPPATPFSSSTLAELYFKQGLVERAADVYRQLLVEEPDNERARARLAELAQLSSAHDDRATRRRALERTIAGLEALLVAVQRR